MKTYREFVSEMSGAGGIGGGHGPTNITGTNVSTDSASIGVKPENMPGRKKKKKDFPKSPVMMNIKRKSPNV